MISEQLLQRAGEIRKKLPAEDMGQRELILAHTVKLGEEVGELCEAVADQYTWQRKKGKHTELGAEIADVILVALILAQDCDVDVNNALEKQLNKIEQRLDVTK